ncbi:MAG TPA: hypothetical protein HA362_05370 [Nanoarchaeota archaeon]|nr:hypothetical protein [Nanoarchaeota archaeon]
MAVKKKPEKRSTPDESVHVRLDSPMAIRKDVISLAIDVIGLLKRYYEYMDTKKQKEDLMRLLRADVGEIKRLTKELDLDEMPLTVGQLMSMHSIEPKDKAEIKVKMAEIDMEEQHREEKRKREIETVKAQIPAAKTARVKQLPKDNLETELAELKKMISSL